MQAWPISSIPALAPDPAQGQVRIYDTLRQELVAVGPERGTARMYVCGITPYDATHLGHATTYVTFDLLQRQWRDCGLNVDYVENVTDIDDPLLERAEQTGVEWTELAEREIALFRDDMAALNVVPPTDYVGAVESIPLVTELLQRFPEGSIYQVDDPRFPDWYFHCDLAPQFGTLSRLDPPTAQRIFAERGGDPDRPGKDHPLDCLVWRLERPGEPAWDSPLGRGRPGWHIECTAIAHRFLGPAFDVQGGGSDLIFPHHEMCAAGAEVVTGEPLAKAYAHAGMVGYQGEKMSKSRGNLVLVSKLRADGVDPMTIRLILLGKHWRDDWSYAEDQRRAAEQRLDRWRAAVARSCGPESELVLAGVRRALRNDLDAPSALAVVDEWAAAQGSDNRAPAEVAAAVDALLGVRLR